MRRDGRLITGCSISRMAPERRVWLVAAFAVAVAACGAAPGGQDDSANEWPAYGRDKGGSRFSPLTQISRDNVSRLAVAWQYRTGETEPRFATNNETSLEVTPIFVEGTLYLSTPIGRVIALDPVSGTERWVFDPRIDRTVDYGDFTNRGVAAWLDPAAPAGAPCRLRIFVAPIDGRLIALDGRDGQPCGAFGEGGTVALKPTLRVAPFEPAAYEVTSPPVVAGDVVIVGSAVADNSRLAPASGEVRAFDARTGAPRWTWDPIPQDPSDPAYATWRDGSAARTGAANVWSVMAVDESRGLVFAPTSSPAPDYYGGARLGSNQYANSIVALRAATGKVAWHFQTVHHDLWDYDNASPPALVDVNSRGMRVPVVLQANKSGQLFVLNRETGAPLFPVAERPVPRSTIPGEEAWPTQPFTTTIPPLSPHTLRANDAWGVDAAEREACRKQIAALRNEGIFTPPSLEGTLVLPSNIGGAHWGGVAVDTWREIAVVPVNRLAAIVQLIPMSRLTEDAADRLEEKTGYPVHAHDGLAVCDAPRLPAIPEGPSLFASAVGLPRRDRSQHGRQALGRSPGTDALAGGHAAVGRLGLAQPGRADRDGRRIGLHRGDARSTHPRVRRRERQRVVVRRAARWRQGDADDLRGGRTPVRRHRRRGRRTLRDGRPHRRVRAAAAVTVASLRAAGFLTAARRCSSRRAPSAAPALRGSAASRP